MRKYANGSSSVSDARGAADRIAVQHATPVDGTDGGVPFGSEKIWKAAGTAALIGGAIALAVWFSPSHRPMGRW